MILRWVTRGWLARWQEFRRWSWATAYLLVSCAGVASLVWPPPSVSAAAGDRPALTYVWAGLMCVSSGLCAVGAFADRWVGEYIGLIPLSMVAAIFGVSALSRGETSRAGGLFLLGFFWILLARWQEFALIKVEASRRAQEIAGISDGGHTPDRLEGGR